MKKLLLVFALIATVSFASCGNKTTSAKVANDSTQVDSVDSVSADSAKLDSVTAK